MTVKGYQLSIEQIQASGIGLSIEWLREDGLQNCVPNDKLINYEL